MTRIVFGKETKLEILSVVCPGCGVSRGQHHEYECPLASCPECGGRLLKCNCMVLPVTDEFKITNAVAKTLTKDQVLKMTKRSKLLDQNYTEKAGFTWITQNAPPRLQREMEEMALEILGAKKHGDRVLVPLDKAAEVMGMSEEEAAPIMQDLETESLYPGWEQKTGMEQ